MKYLLFVGIFILRVIGVWLINISINCFIPTIPVNILYDFLFALGIIFITINIKLNL